MSGNIPDELSYEIGPAPPAVVVSRTESFLSSPGEVYSSDSNSVLRFHLTGSSMVDLSSLRLYSDLTGVLTKAVGATSTTVTGGAATEPTTPLPNSTYGIFSQMTLASGDGTVLESLNDCVVLSRIIESMSFGRQWANTGGTFLNAWFDPAYRNNLGTSTRYEVGAIKMLGFLNSGKYVIPNSFGGIVLTLTIAPGRQIFTGRGGYGDNFNLQMRGTSLHYDSCLMSERYQAHYNQSYLSGGFRIVFDSYQGHTSNTLTSTASQQTTLAIAGKRSKAIMSVLRRQAYINNVAFSDKSATAFLSHTTGLPPHYSYEFSGVRMPPSGISNVPQAHNECLKICYSTHDTHRECSSMNAWSFDHQEGTYATRDAGTFIMGLDLEKFTSSGESGLAINPSSTSLILDANFTDNTGPYQLDTFLIRSQSVTVANGRILIDF